MFKEKYKRDNEMINPSQEFLEKLKIEMKKEESLRKKESLGKEHGLSKAETLEKRHRHYSSRKMLAAAAAIALVIISAGSYNKFSNTNKNTIMYQTEISEKNGSTENSTNSSNSSNGGNSGNSNSTEDRRKVQDNQLFSNSSWYDSKMSSEEIYKTFLNRIISQDDLKELNVSSTNDFTSSKIMDRSSVNRLADLLKGGTLIKDESCSKENPKYYMASFNNGDIIKFVIYDGNYFECSEFEGIFSIRR